jgi:hypothetical protein
VAPSRTVATATLLTAGLALGGCGGGGSAARTATATSPPASARPAAPPPPPAAPSAERVIRRWATTLRHGDVTGAARYFALPAIVQLDPAQPALLLTRRAQVRAFNRALPCGATVIRTERRGAYAETLFRLVQRPGAVCDGPGNTARAAFRVRNGRIVEWRRRLDQADDGQPVPPPADRGGQQLEA